MSNGFPLMALSELLIPISRPESTVLEKQYHILGAHWYAQGLYTKDVKLGSEIKADKVYRVEEGDFVYNRLFAWKGSFAIASQADHGCYVSNEFPCFRIKQDKINGKYLWKYFSRSSAWNEALGLSSGGTPTSRNRLKEEKLLAMEIPLPSREEQRRIVARVEELAAKIEEAIGLRLRAMEEVEMLQALSLKKMRKELLTSSYSKNRIGHITQVSSGGTPSRGILSYWNGNIPWIKTGELLDRDIFQAEEYITEEGLANSAAKLFPLDTILVALYGQGQTRGRTGRLMIEAATNQACCAILPTPASLEPRFTQYWLRSLYLEMREVVRDGAQPNWNGQMIKNIEIALPPLSEQKRIVAYFDNLQSKVNSQKQLQSETSAELDALLPSILDKAFKGDL